MQHMFMWFMSPMHIICGLINALFVYLTIYYFLYCLKHPIHIAYSAFILLVLSCLSILTCPIIGTIFMYCANMMKMVPMMQGYC
jgi:hypothetical protein